MISQRWGLFDIQPVPNLSYNFVAFAKRVSTSLTSEQEDVILKIGVPRNELVSEISALKLFSGDGACQLLESDEERDFARKTQPGIML
jgi:streptomycin 6-kinase